MTRVDSFEDLIVILMKDNQVKVVHGSINNSQPGVWQSRESANIVIVDCNVKPTFKWWDEIVNGAGETLREYRKEATLAAFEESLEAGGELKSLNPLIVIRELSLPANL